MAIDGDAVVSWIIGTSSVAFFKRDRSVKIQMVVLESLGLQNDFGHEPG